MDRYGRLMRVRNALVYRSFERGLSPRQAEMLERVHRELDAIETARMDLSPIERLVELHERLAERVTAAASAPSAASPRDADDGQT